jgi:hypothetical protein
VLEFRVHVVFTDFSVRHGKNKVTLVKDGAAYKPTWTMRALTVLLVRVRERLLEVRQRYEELKRPGPAMRRSA